MVGSGTGKRVCGNVCGNVVIPGAVPMATSWSWLSGGDCEVGGSLFLTSVPTLEAASLTTVPS